MGLWALAGLFAVCREVAEVGGDSPPALDPGPGAVGAGTHRLAFGSTGPRPTLGSFHTWTSRSSMVALVTL